MKAGGENLPYLGDCPVFSLFLSIAPVLFPWAAGGVAKTACNAPWPLRVQQSRFWPFCIVRRGFFSPPLAVGSDGNGGRVVHGSGATMCLPPSLDHCHQRLLLLVLAMPASSSPIPWSLCGRGPPLPFHFCPRLPSTLFLIKVADGREGTKGGGIYSFPIPDPTGKKDSQAGFFLPAGP